MAVTRGIDVNPLTPGTVEESVSHDGTLGTEAGMSLYFTTYFKSLAALRVAW